MKKEPVKKESVNENPSKKLQIIRAYNIDVFFVFIRTYNIAQKKLKDPPLQ